MEPPPYINYLLKWLSKYFKPRGQVKWCTLVRPHCYFFTNAKVQTQSVCMWPFVWYLSVELQYLSTSCLPTSGFQYASALITLEKALHIVHIFAVLTVHYTLSSHFTVTEETTIHHFVNKICSFKITWKQIEHKSSCYFVNISSDHWLFSEIYLQFCHLRFTLYCHFTGT